MATHRRKPKRHPSIKSKAKKIPKGLDYSNASRNVGTLRKIEKAIQEEKDQKE